MNLLLAREEGSKEARHHVCAAGKRFIHRTPEHARDSSQVASFGSISPSNRVRKRYEARKEHASSGAASMRIKLGRGEEHQRASTSRRAYVIGDLFTAHFTRRTEARPSKWNVVS